MADTNLPTLEGFFGTATAASQRSSQAAKIEAAGTQDAGLATTNALTEQLNALKTLTSETTQQLGTIDKSLEAASSQRDKAAQHLEDLMGMPKPLVNLRVILGDESYSRKAAAAAVAESERKIRDQKFKRDVVVQNHGILGNAIAAESTAAKQNYDITRDVLNAQSESANREMANAFSSISALATINAEQRAAKSFKYADLKNQVETVHDNVFQHLDFNAPSYKTESGDEIPMSFMREEQQRRTRAIRADELAVSSIAVSKLAGLKAQADLDYYEKNPDARANAAAMQSRKDAIELQQAALTFEKQSTEMLLDAQPVGVLQQIQADGGKFKLSDGSEKIFPRNLVDSALEKAVASDEKRAASWMAGQSALQTLEEVTPRLGLLSVRVNAMGGSPELANKIDRIARMAAVPPNVTLNENQAQQLATRLESATAEVEKEAFTAFEATFTTKDKAFANQLWHGNVQPNEAAAYMTGGSFNVKSLPVDSLAASYASKIYPGIYEKFQVEMGLAPARLSPEDQAKLDSGDPAFMMQQMMKDLGTKDSQTKTKGEQVMQRLIHDDLPIAAQRLMDANVQANIYKQIGSTTYSLSADDVPAEFKSAQPDIAAKIPGLNILEYAGTSMDQFLNARGEIQYTALKDKLKATRMPDGVHTAWDWTIARMKTPEVTNDLIKGLSKDLAKYPMDRNTQAFNAVAFGSGAVGLSVRKAQANVISTYSMESAQTESLDTYAKTEEAQQLLNSPAWSGMSDEQKAEQLKIRYRVRQGLKLQGYSPEMQAKILQGAEARRAGN